jgi:hypothetical protein
MGETLSAEQVRERSIAAMPAPLGEIHYALHNEVAWLHVKWKNYRALFARDQETIDLLNAAAPAFFHALQRMMWEDVLLHLCRLTDPPKSVGRDNLTVRRLPDTTPDPNLQNQVRPLVDDVNQRTQFARDWRNRRLAHRELPPTSGQAAQPLASISRQQIEDALGAIRRTMNCIEQHYLHAPVSYEHSVEALGGVESLLARLRKSVQGGARIRS